MKGYNTLKQFTYDYRLYMTARKNDPGKRGETITSLLKKQIDSRLKNATKAFKSMLKRRDYTKEDLTIIATHDTIGPIENIDKFIKECFRTEQIRSEHYRRLFRSGPYKTGRLKKLYALMPARIETRRQFIFLIKRRHGISTTELPFLMNHLCKKDWRRWLNELIDEEKIWNDNGRWYI